MHIPVLLKESIEGLAIKPAGIYIDATFGRGGHTQAILDQLGPYGQLIAIDKDGEAVAYGREKFNKESRFFIEQGSFAHLTKIAKHHGVFGQVDGVLLDLGVSSVQLEDSQRGFSFIREGPLDMRMDVTQNVSAYEWINHAKEEEIAFILNEFGEERFSGRIARAIVENRTVKPIRTTKELADLITRIVPFRERKKHPATRTFQAIRIYINEELQDLESCLTQCLDVLAGQGRMVIISFHSLEDRIVKQFIRDHSRQYEPVIHPWIEPKKIKPLLGKIGRSIKPADTEIKYNPRARSAILRIAEKFV